MAKAKWILTACVLMPLLGCASLSDYKYEETQRSRARTAWRAHGSNCKPKCYGKDYESGWKDGFYDVATGGKGCPPVVAPCQYWKPSQILEDRDRARLAYYSGFQDGVACAIQYPQTHYLKLWTSCECPGPSCEKQCATAAGCLSGGCLSGQCGSSSEELMGEYDVIETQVESPSVPQQDLPVPSTSTLNGESESSGPEAMPEAQPNAEQVQTGFRPGTELAQPYHRFPESGAHASEVTVLGLRANFDQMIEDSSSQIMRCTSKEPSE